VRGCVQTTTNGRGELSTYCRESRTDIRHIRSLGLSEPSVLG
jgi:hypothetical protein